ncbi:MAG: carbamoyltransferase HypF [Verrucomicrobia bacterium]|nr:carbamoyltransferase HypF [Verrucomicrobiota bacterium]
MGYVASPGPVVGGETGGVAVRARLAVRGVVQGVGFRPFVFRLATELGLAGWVSNSAQGVVLEVEGPADAVRRLLVRLDRERPPHSSIQSLETTYLDPVGHRGFAIRPSEPGGEKTALVLPDIAPCAACLRELWDPADRRHAYPFINCTHCGPRYSIIEALPYDRPNTSMKGFTLCAACRAEYEDPRNRRFHAQPNACPACGPHLELWDPRGRCLRSHHEVLTEAAHALREGAIVAVKGVGGFQLLVLADEDSAVLRLRRLKRREAKPLALMMPTLRMIGEQCRVDELEERLLRSAEAPIVLLRRRSPAELGSAPLRIASAVAPGNPYWGVMLPSTPLHHLLLRAVGRPVVATSGNLAEEPICIDEREALERLAGIADLFLVHDRPIVRHVDDSVARVVLGRELMLRRARGYAPLPIWVREELPATLAVGAQLKNTVALARGQQVYLSQHIGDLENAVTLAAFERVMTDLRELYGVRPEVVAADAHPDYLSTQHAHRTAQNVICVQHHCAHVLACMAENDAPAPLLGASWDGTGFGVDETVWGGEFFRVFEDHFERVGYLRTFRLPGGEQAVKEPRRSGLGLLHAVWGAEAFEMKDLPTLQAFSSAELKTLRHLLDGRVQAPLTSSAGRLFDAIASIVGLRQRVHFEGQAALDLEFALERDESDESYPIRLLTSEELEALNGELTMPCPLHANCAALRPSLPRFLVDWGPMLEGILADLRNLVPAWDISAKFHNTLADAIVAVAQSVGDRRVVLTGGCFQNRYLLERAVQSLRSAGFSPYWHQRVPPNDGGIALGQAVAAAYEKRQRRPHAAP